LLEAVAVAIGFEDVNVMCQAVEESASEALGAEHADPVLEWQIGGHQRRAALVALRDHLNEQFRTGLRERDVSQLVENQKQEPGERGLEAEQALLVARFGELVHEPGGSGEADGQSALAGRRSIWGRDACDIRRPATITIQQRNRRDTAFPARQILYVFDSLLVVRFRHLPPRAAPAGANV